MIRNPSPSSHYSLTSVSWQLQIFSWEKCLKLRLPPKFCEGGRRTHLAWEHIQNLVPAYPSDIQCILHWGWWAGSCFLSPSSAHWYKIGSGVGCELLLVLNGAVPFSWLSAAHPWRWRHSQLYQITQPLPTCVMAVGENQAFLAKIFAIWADTTHTTSCSA